MQARVGKWFSFPWLQVMHFAADLIWDWKIVLMSFSCVIFLLFWFAVSSNTGTLHQTNNKTSQIMAAKQGYHHRSPNIVDMMKYCNVWLVNAGWSVRSKSRDQCPGRQQQTGITHNHNQQHTGGLENGSENTNVRNRPSARETLYRFLAGPFCVEFACPRCVCMGSLWVLQFPSWKTRMLG